LLRRGVYWVFAPPLPSEDLRFAKNVQLVILSKIWHFPCKKKITTIILSSISQYLRVLLGFSNKKY